MKKSSCSVFLLASQARSHAFLQQSSFFRECSASFLTSLMQDLKTDLFSAGDIIMQEGGAADKLFCLEMGQVDILIGKDLAKVGSVGEGSVFGEMAMFQHLGPSFSKRSASVRAACFCVCRAISHVEFHRILKRFPKEKRIFEKVALQRQRELQVKKKEHEDLKLTEKDLARSAILWDQMRTHIRAVRSYERETAAWRNTDSWYSGFQTEPSDACTGDPESKILPVYSADVTVSYAAQSQGESLRPSTSGAVVKGLESGLVRCEDEQMQQQRPALLPRTTGVSPRSDGLASPRSPMSSRPHTSCPRQKSPESNKAASGVLALRDCKYGLPQLPGGISTRGRLPQAEKSFEVVPPPEIHRHYCPFTEPSFASKRPVTAPTPAPKSARAYLENLKVPKGSRRGWVELE